MDTCPLCVYHVYQLHCSLSNTTQTSSLTAKNDLQTLEFTLNSLGFFFSFKNWQISFNRSFSPFELSLHTLYQSKSLSKERMFPQGASSRQALRLLPWSPSRSAQSSNSISGINRWLPERTESEELPLNKVHQLQCVWEAALTNSHASPPSCPP